MAPNLRPPTAFMRQPQTVMATPSMQLKKEMGWNSSILYSKDKKDDESNVPKGFEKFMKKGDKKSSSKGK